MSAPLVSVVTPCYNHGIYIREAINSLKAITDPTLYELIIVNDGSTDPYTLTVMAELEQEGYRVVHQPNMGLSEARNTAVRLAKGKYIMPLDADNRLLPGYIYKGLDILENNPLYSMVYGNCLYFGDQEGEHTVGEFNLQRMLITNFIDACALYRKSVWEENGGYDPQINVLSDWDFWLNSLSRGHRFYYIPEVLYHYRVLNSSMVRSYNRAKQNGNKHHDYLINKYPHFFGLQYIDENIMRKFAEAPLGFIGKLFIKQYLPQYFEKLVAQGKLRRYI